MGSRKIVQDSGDESIVVDSPRASGANKLELSLSPIIDLQYSSPPKIHGHSVDTATGSTESPEHGACLNLDSFGPGAESSDNRTNMTPFAQQQHAPPKGLRDSNRRATTAFSEQREKKPLKTYGSRGSQDTVEFYRHSDDEDHTRPRKRLKSHRETNKMGSGSLDHKAHDATTQDPAASRVEAMLNSYHGAEDLLSGNLTLGSFPSIHTSAQTSMTPKTPKLSDSRGALRSQQSTITTVADTTPARSNGASSAESNEPKNSKETIPDPNTSSRTSEEFNEHVHKKPGKRSQAELEDEGVVNNENTLVPWASQASGRSTVRERSVDIFDELASSSSKPPASTAKRKSSEINKRLEVESTKQADDLGSDGIAVGLPKEEYHPRPSRSRSKRNDEDLIIPESFSKRPEALAKKKASKRRKTTALAKASPKVEVEDDDDEDPDVTIVPARKMDKAKKDIEPVVLLPTEDAEPEEGKAEHAEQADLPVEKSKPVAEEAPASEKAPPGSPAKKKRGRPKKPSTDPVADEAPQDEQVLIDNDEGLPDLLELTKTTMSKRGRKKKTDQDETPAILNDNTDETDVGPHEDDNNIGTHLSRSEGNRQVIAKDANASQLSPAKLTTPPETPRKSASKGPDKHSPLNSGKVRFRVGLSKRARIEPLLKIVRK